MSSSMNIDSKKKILVEGPTQGSDDTALIAEPKYPINFTQRNKRSTLSRHYNGSNTFLLVNATQIIQFKAKFSEIKDYALFLVNISKCFAIVNMKKQD